MLHAYDLCWKVSSHNGIMRTNNKEVFFCCSGQYGHSYSYQSNQQNVPLPGQLQPTATIQPNLPGQSAQLHVTHHTPPGGIQTVHQTQVPAFGQTATGAQQVQNVTREYMVQTPGGMTGQQIHQGIHQNPTQAQVHLAR